MPKNRGERRETFLPFSRPTIEAEEIDEVVDSLRSGWLTSGPKVERLEAAFCERLGVAHAVAVNSATAGLHLAVAALELEPADEVIVPSLTWAATANVVELCGGRTVFADVDPRTYCLDVADVASRIGERTRAIIPVHFAGQPVDLDALRRVAHSRDIQIIHDAAHALGSFYGDEEIGSSGEVTVFSFHPIKNITTGEGGMIVTDSEDLAERFRTLRFHGVSREAWKRHGRAASPGYDVLAPGWKYNMLDLQAAIGIHQLAKLERFNAARSDLAGNYDRLLEDLPLVGRPERVPYFAVHAWHLYVIRLELSALDVGRDEIAAELARENIGTGLHFPPLHLSSYYRDKYGLAGASLPGTEYAGERILSLPLYPLLTEDDQKDVVEALSRVLDRHGSAVS